MQILALSGSLRAFSANTALLRAATALAPEDVKVLLYGAIGSLPHFNPDLDDEVGPPAVVDFRRQLAAADALLISSPEYARGVPGSLKNALDWLRTGGELAGKPVGVLNASAGATLARASLTETLAVMHARVVPQASITILVGTLDPGAIAAEPVLASQIRSAIAALIQATVG